MKPKVVRKPSADDPRWRLAERIVLFVNTVFDRKLRTSRALYDAVVSALDNGYTEDEIRIACWAARCTENWLREMLGEGLGPEYILRFKGGTNPETGKEAKRWLDEMSSRIDEMNPIVVGRVLKLFPDDFQKEEREFLTRLGVGIKEEK
jgi:hypothetical protein